MGLPMKTTNAFLIAVGVLAFAVVLTIRFALAPDEPEAAELSSTDPYPTVASLSAPPATIPAGAIETGAPVTPRVRRDEIVNPFSAMLTAAGGNPDEVVVSDVILLSSNAEEVVTHHFNAFLDALVATGKGQRNDIDYRHELGSIPVIQNGEVSLQRLECSEKICAASLYGLTEDSLIDATRQLGNGDGPKVYAVFSHDVESLGRLERRLIFSVDPYINAIGNGGENIGATAGRSQPDGLPSRIGVDG